MVPMAGETTWVDGRPGENPFKDGLSARGWDGEHDVRGTGGDERPKGAGLLHHIGQTRSGSSTGDQRWHGQLTPCAVTPALQVMGISWTLWSLGSCPGMYSVCTVWSPLGLESSFF